MDGLVAFLENAEWEKRGKNTSICLDKHLPSELDKLVSRQPNLKGYGLQVWKTIGGVRIHETSAYLIPIHIIEGTARVQNGPELTPASQPFYFSEEIVIHGSLYYVVAYPPELKLD